MDCATPLAPEVTREASARCCSPVIDPSQAWSRCGSRSRRSGADDLSGAPRRVRRNHCVRGGPRGSPRNLSQCWAGSINEILRASGSAGSSYRFTELFFQFAANLLCRIRVPFTPQVAPSAAAISQAFAVLRCGARPWNRRWRRRKTHKANAEIVSHAMASAGAATART